MVTDYQKKYFRYQDRFKQIRSLSQRPVVRNYLWLSLTLFSIAFLLLAAIRPTLTTIAGLVKEIEDKKEVSRKLSKKINSLTQAQVEYEKIKPQLVHLNQAVPPQPNFANLVWEIEYLANKNQVSLIGLGIDKVTLLGKPNKEKESNIDPKAPVKISLELVTGGSYESIKSFLNELEQLKRIVQINEIGFVAETSEEYPLQTSFQAEVFYLPEKT